MDEAALVAHLATELCQSRAEVEALQRRVVHLFAQHQRIATEHAATLAKLKHLEARRTVGLGWGVPSGVVAISSHRCHSE